MVIPRRVKILGVPYRIVEAPHADMGCTGVDGQTITVHPDQAPAQKRITLLHECLHAVISGGALRAWLKDSDTEETFVAGLDNALYQLLRDNPALVEFICE